MWTASGNLSAIDGSVDRRGLDDRPPLRLEEDVALEQAAERPVRRHDRPLELGRAVDAAHGHAHRRDREPVRQRACLGIVGSRVAPDEPREENSWRMTSSSVMRPAGPLSANVRT